MVAGGQTFLANDFQTAGKSCTAGLAHILLLKISLAVKTSQTGVAVRTNGAVRLSAVFAEMTVAADIPAALSAIFAVFVFAAGDTIPALGAVFVFFHIGKTFSAAVAMSGFITFAIGTPCSGRSFRSNSCPSGSVRSFRSSDRRNSPHSPQAAKAQTTSYISNNVTKISS